MPVALTIGQSKNQPRTEDIASWKRAGLRPLGQIVPLFIGKRKQGQLTSKEVPLAVLKRLSRQAIGEQFVANLGIFFNK